MPFLKANSYCERCINSYRVFIGGLGGVEGACKASKIIGQEKLFNHQKKFIRNFSGKLAIPIRTFCQNALAICELLSFMSHPGITHINNTNKTSLL